VWIEAPQATPWMRYFPVDDPSFHGISRRVLDSVPGIDVAHVHVQRWLCGQRRRQRDLWLVYVRWAQRASAMGSPIFFLFQNIFAEVGSESISISLRLTVALGQR
jgi:hypothetical protein